MLSFECIKNEKSVYFLLISAVSGNSYDLSAQSPGQHITTGTLKSA